MLSHKDKKHRKERAEQERLAGSGGWRAKEEAVSDRQSSVSCNPGTLRRRGLRQVGVSWNLGTVRGTLDSLCPLPSPDIVRQLRLLPRLPEPHTVGFPRYEQARLCTHRVSRQLGGEMSEHWDFSAPFSFSHRCLEGFYLEKLTDP